MKMMIVDDDQYITNLVAYILKRNNVEVVSHSNVGDALRNLIAEDFDGIIIDLHLPGIDGLTAIPLAKEIRPGINAGLMTADTSSGIRKKALDSGADFFLQKPVDILRLWDVIKDGVKKEGRDVKGSSAGRF